MAEDIKYVKNMINTVCPGYLTTMNNKLNIPETRAMANTRLYDTLKTFFKGKENIIYFISHKSSPKAIQIDKNSASSIYFPDSNSKTMESLTVYGKSRIVDDKKLKNEIWQDDWKQYYKSGKEDPEYVLIEFTIEKYKFYGPNYKIHEGNFK